MNRSPRPRSRRTGLAGKTRKLILALFAILAVSGGVGVGMFWTDLKVWRGVARFRDAPAGDRQHLGADLVALGEPAVPGLLECLRVGDAELARATRKVLADMLANWGPDDLRTERMASRLFAAYSELGDPGQAALLRLMPAVRHTHGPDHAEQRAQIVRSALAHPAPELRIDGIRLALWPEVMALAEVVPLLKAPEPEVRRAAMLAVGPVRPDGPDPERDLIRTEELLHWLHDADPEVRQICEMSLRSRGLSEEEIRRGRLLTHPEASQRTRLLAELIRDERVDLSSWLERLSRDPNPSVRASAARAIGEGSVGLIRRLEQMGNSDPDPTVRRIAEFYRVQKSTDRLRN